MNVVIYFGEERVANLVAPSEPGWRVESIDTTLFQGQPAVVSYLVTTSNARYRHFHFDFKPSR